MSKSWTWRQKNPKKRRNLMIVRKHRLHQLASKRTLLTQDLIRKPKTTRRRKRELLNPQVKSIKKRPKRK